MANRSVSVTLRANVADFRAQMRQAGTSLDDLVKKADKTQTVASTGLGRMAQSMEHQRAEWDRVGGAITAFGLGTVAALGASAGAAIEWESAFAGVLKTVDGSDAQLSALESNLRGMARELPATHVEIAAVAEAAGQLGIATPNIEAFTRTMIDLGESTNMSADEAATALARFANIMGTSQTEFSNIGSAVVELGNNFATTEGEIVAMSLRLAGAGSQLGLAEAEVMALATAMSSMGIEAEAGGTAMSQTMLQMRDAVDEGGESLQAFADTAGMSSEAFAQLFRESPADAIHAVVAGLGEMEAQGINTSTALDDMGAKGLRQSDTLRRLSGNAELLAEAFGMANSAYAENTALSDEATQRYETLESKIQVFKNTVKDAAIGMGQMFMPLIEFFTWAGSGFVSLFADLPVPIQAVAAGLSSVAGMSALALGGFMLLAPRVVETVKAFNALKDANIPVISRGLEVMGKHGKTAGLMLGAAGLALGLSQAGDEGRKFASTSTDIIQRLQEIQRAGEGSLFDSWDASDITSMLDDLNGGMNALESSTLWLGQRADGIAAIFGKDTRHDLTKFKQELEGIDEALVKMPVEDAQAAFGVLASETDGSVTALMNLLDLLPGFKSQLVDTAVASGMAADDLAILKSLLGDDMPDTWIDTLLGPLLDLPGATGPASDGLDDVTTASSYALAAAERLGIAEEELSGIYEAQYNTIWDVIEARLALNNESRTAQENELAWARASEGMTKALEDESVALNKSKDGWDLRSSAGQQAFQASKDYADVIRDTAIAEWDRTNSIDAVFAAIEPIADEYREQAESIGLSGEALEAYMAEMNMIPEDVVTKFVVDLEDWHGQVNGIHAEFDQETLTLEVDGDTVPLENTVAETLGLIADTNGEITVNGNTLPAETTWFDFLLLLGQTEPEVDLGMSDEEARRVLSELEHDVDVSYEEVDVGAEDSWARSTAAELLAWIEAQGENVDVDADTSFAHADVNQMLAETKQKNTYVNVDANRSPFDLTIGGIIGKTVGTAYIALASRNVLSTGSKLNDSPYWSGGYTGPGPKYEPAGIVHRGEVVFSQDDVARHGGVAAVEALRLSGGAAQRGNYVSATSAVPRITVAGPSLEGLQIAGSIQVGDALVPLVDARIESADRKKRIVGRRP